MGRTTPDGAPLADLGSRLLARILDYLLTTIATSLLGLPLLLPLATEIQDRYTALAAGRPVDSAQLTTDMLTLMTDLTNDPQLRTRLWLFQLLSVVVSAVYTVVLLRLRGATLGKLALGVRVRPWAADGRLTWNQALARWVTREGVQNVPVVGPMYWVLDSFWPLWDDRRQGLHDKLPGTVVVKAGHRRY